MGPLGHIDLMFIPDDAIVPGLVRFSLYIMDAMAKVGIVSSASI